LIADIREDQSIHEKENLLSTVSLSRRKVPLSTKIIQGIGAMPDTLKNYGFGTLLLFYYNQVLGVSGTLCGWALGIAMCFDAITDPMVGSASDNLRSRLGRRHPFMYAAALPMSVTMYLIFVPPNGLTEFQLFLWLTVFAVLVRTSMTLFHVPWTALQAELSQDYHERTSVVAYRFLFGWIAAISAGFCTMRFLFPTTPEYTPGHLNPAGYPVFATIVSIIIGVSILFTTHFSRKEIPYLPKPPDIHQPFGLINVLREVWLALQNKMFLLNFSNTLFVGAIGGTIATLGIYMQTYFWGLIPEEIAWYSLSFIGAIAAFLLVKPIQMRFDKKYILIFCWTLGLLDGVFMINLRLYDILPPNGNPWLLRLLVINAIFTTAIGVVAGMLGPSLMADILDQQELKTGKRQEGIFFSAMSFSGKAISGLGVIIGGLIIDMLRLPQGANPALVDPAIIRNLGLVVGIGLPMLFLVPIAAFGFWYNITQDKHAQIREELDRRFDDTAGKTPASGGIDTAYP
jgi:GPH family glycoside/pentoside/hexuronide:cation symporter